MAHGNIFRPFTHREGIRSPGRMEAGYPCPGRKLQSPIIRLVTRPGNFNHIQKGAIFRTTPRNGGHTSVETQEESRKAC